jgi:hypothetical protein
VSCGGSIYLQVVTEILWPLFCQVLYPKGRESDAVVIWTRVHHSPNLCESSEL